MMQDSVFTTFKVWDNGDMSKKEVLNLAYDHFMDIQDTFGLDRDSSVRQVEVATEGDEGRVYLFEIIEPKFVNNH